MSNIDPTGPPMGPRSGSGTVWPFAITRSVDTGFHVVVAPDFLVDCDLHHLLSDVVAGEAAKGTAYLREYLDRGERGLWVLYRVGHLRGADLGLDTEYALHGSRRTPLVEGIVCSGRPHPPTDDLFDWIHAICADPVKAFFDADSDTHPVRSSEGAEPPTTGTALRVVEENVYRSERNLQVALTGRRPLPPRSSPTDAPSVRTDGRESAADTRSVPAGHGGVCARCCGVDRCAQRIRRARHVALASTVVALGLGLALMVVLLR
ncbi:hypothetical protein AB0N81_17515 [Streptomyces sp. NPDC093510]|uniref:hypothetical protein n=1 Tax=Streptomyces sp. NPDC093510 TaxID=3155199 RepID=UPI0034449244